MAEDLIYMAAILVVGYLTYHYGKSVGAEEGKMEFIRDLISYSRKRGILESELNLPYNGSSTGYTLDTLIKDVIDHKRC